MRWFLCYAILVVCASAILSLGSCASGPDIPQKANSLFQAFRERAPAPELDLFSPDEESAQLLEAVIKEYVSLQIFKREEGGDFAVIEGNFCVNLDALLRKIWPYTPIVIDGLLASSRPEDREMAILIIGTEQLTGAYDSRLGAMVTNDPDLGCRTEAALLLAERSEQALVALLKAACEDSRNNFRKVIYKALLYRLCDATFMDFLVEARPLLLSDRLLRERLVWYFKSVLALEQPFREDTPEVFMEDLAQWWGQNRLYVVEHSTWALGGLWKDLDRQGTSPWSIRRVCGGMLWTRYVIVDKNAALNQIEIAPKTALPATAQESADREKFRQSVFQLIKGR